MRSYVAAYFLKKSQPYWMPAYKFKRGFATPIIFIFDLRRNVPYFYDTFRVEKITLVAELNVIPDAPWW